jgi:Rieske 2Fe-2S family protein
VLHGKSFGRFFDWTPENVSLKDNGGITIRYEAAPSTPEGKTLFTKAPWLEDRGMEFACTGYLPPNLTIFGRIDCVKIMCAWPTGFDSCHIEIHLLMPAQFFADPEFEKKLQVYVDYQAVIYEEDRTMIESMQKAMALPQYQPGRLSTMEKPIHHFLSRYTERMFGPSSKTTTSANANTAAG